MCDGAPNIKMRHVRFAGPPSRGYSRYPCKGPGTLDGRTAGNSKGRSWRKRGPISAGPSSTDPEVEEAGSQHRRSGGGGGQGLAAQVRRRRRPRPSSISSLNCMDWCLIPPATEAIIAEAQVIKGRFIGDPSHEYEHAVSKKVGEGDAAYEEEVTSHIKEETRLVATIAMIDKEAAVVPRGAFIKNPLGRVKKNLCFRGLTTSEAKKQSSFFHFTFTVNPKKRSLLEKADLDPSIDFLDSLEHDIPRGCWSLQFEQGNSVVILRSLLWMGMTFYHVPLTPQHGYVYIGTGERNNDLPFMI